MEYVIPSITKNPTKSSILFWWIFAKEHDFYIIPIVTGTLVTWHGTMLAFGESLITWYTPAYCNNNSGDNITYFHLYSYIKIRQKEIKLLLMIEVIEVYYFCPTILLSYLCNSNCACYRIFSINFSSFLLNFSISLIFEAYICF